MIAAKEIPAFLETKALSENSKSNYTYDLKHFCTFMTSHGLTQSAIDLYRKQLSQFAPSAQKRKVSAVNQFLRYLYQKEILDDYFQLTAADPIADNKGLPPLLDLSSFYGPIKSTGQFLATLILETGLTPSEICALHWSDFNWRFNILEVTSANGKKRALGLQNKFAVRAKLIRNGDDLFSKTRQYIHVELKKFTHYTARELREQFILRQIKSGSDIYDLQRMLGLSTIITLERYFKK
ncbi:MAG: site-specific tyrosine recombinase XerD [Streptococcaceae bacterium]|jgi:site-specific recombinase XerD|nr:site-specific tyrosine recombinase XerD [Streptococcaceae bacterium]